MNVNKLIRALVLVAVFGVGLWIATKGGSSLFRGDTTQNVKTGDFYAMVDSGDVLKGTFVKNDEFDGIKTKGGGPFVANVPPEDSQDRAVLYQKLRTAHVQYDLSHPFLTDSTIGMFVSFLLPLGVIFFFWMFFLRQAQSGGNQALSFGRARAKRLTDSVPKVTFDDVAGVDEAKQELQEVVEFLKNAKKFQALGAKIPKGVLLLGPPGCGKTMLARAIAGEAGVPFFHISGSDFVEMFVGVGASRVRDLFDTAKANRPSLIFIDEIDAVGRQRGAGLGGGHDEREQTLNQLLVEMDGFDPNAGVIMIAATNRPDVLDPALLRPGRFDRQVTVDTPDAKGREAILNVHLRGKPIADDVNAQALSRRTPGFSGADLANLVNEAALLAARKDKTRIETPDFNESIDRVVAGPERKSRIMNDQVRERIAYHEVGHAVVGELLPNANPVHKISILPRGRALGLHHADADRGQVPDHAPGVSGRHQRPAGGPRRRGDRLQRGDDGGVQRLRACHRHRPRHGLRVRHERPPRPGGAGDAARQSVPGPGLERGAQLLGDGRRGDRQGGSGDHRGLLRALAPDPERRTGPRWTRSSACCWRKSRWSARSSSR